MHELIPFYFQEKLLLGPLAVMAIMAGVQALGMFASNASQRKHQREVQARQNAYNEDQALRAHQRDISFWNAQNLYNSPQEQKNRLYNAGINPSMLNQGGISPGLAGSTPKITPQKDSRTPEPIFQAGDALAPFTNLAMQKVGIDNQVQQTQNLKVAEDNAKLDGLQKMLDLYSKNLDINMKETDVKYYPDFQKNKLLKTQQELGLNILKGINMNMDAFNKAGILQYQSLKNQQLENLLPVSELEGELAEQKMFKQDPLWMRQLAAQGISVDSIIQGITDFLKGEESEAATNVKKAVEDQGLSTPQAQTSMLSWLLQYLGASKSD